MANIALGTDHAGLQIANKLRTYLSEKGYDVVDFGTHSAEPTDYPIYASKVAEHVQTTKDLGILVCSSGIGMSIAANRYNGVYAARCVNASEAQTAKKTGANILCLGSKSANFDETRAIIDAFLVTESSNEPRHKDRLALIDRLASKT